MAEHTDPLDSHIEANRGMGHRYYAEALEIIRDRLRTLEAPGPAPFKRIAWLIECSFKGGAPGYYCSPGMWCDNPNHAHKFLTKEAAETRSAEMTTIGTRRVCDHSWA
jgi:hypothetical protein